MNEKTEALRDLFVDTTGTETVTERQSESPGSLTDRDEDAVAARIAEVVSTMRDRYAFSTDLDDDGYRRVAVGFFDGEDDATIAAAIADGSGDTDAEMNTAVDVAIDADTVRHARFDLHLVDDDDRDTPTDIEYAAVKRAVAADRSLDELAASLGVDPETVEASAPAARADLASTRVSDRFRDELRALLTDADLEGSHAAAAREDGLEEATEDIETDVSL